MTLNAHNATVTKVTSRWYHELAGLIMVSCVVFITGCDRNSQANESRSVIENRLDLIWSCETADDLKEFYAKHSLAGNVKIQTEGRLIFVQTFPYSGVRASHLCVYAADTGGMRLAAFFYIPSQDNVVLNSSDSGSIEIRADDKRIAILE